MRTLLLSLLALSIVGPLAKADSLDYKYTWHIDGVVLPGDGLRLPSIELAFLAADDLSYGPPANYDFGETTTNVVTLYLRESVSPSSPFYLSPFEGFSGFSVGFHEIGLEDEFFDMGNVGGYDNNVSGQPYLPVDLPGPASWESLPARSTAFRLLSSIRRFIRATTNPRSRPTRFGWTWCLSQARLVC